MRIRGMAALVLVASVLVGCGAGDVVVDDVAAWRTSQDRVEVSGLTWATGSTVHLPDGSTIDTGEPVQAFVVGGDGVFFVPVGADEADGNGTFRGADLFFVAPGSEPTDTGMDVDTTGLRTSPDGTHLAVLEADYDEGSAVMRLFDLSTGDDVTAEDGWESGSSDPVDELLEAEVEILGIDDEEVFARTLEGDLAYDLVAGTARALDDDEQVPGDLADPLASPDGAWRIEQPAGLRDVLVPEAGNDRLPDTGTSRWTLAGWIDATTALGVAIDGPGGGEAIGPDDTLTLMTCSVPSGACDLLADTAGEVVVLPLGRPTTQIDLRPRR